MTAFYDVFNGDAVVLADELDKALQIFDQAIKVVGISSFPRRMSVPSRIPGENRDIFQRQYLDDILKTS